jgi:hypothetical protein
VVIRKVRRPCRGLRCGADAACLSAPSLALVGFTWSSRMLGGSILSNRTWIPRAPRVAGRWHFPAPSFAFAVAGLAFEGIAKLALPASCDVGRRPPWPSLPSRAAASAREVCSVRRRVAPTLAEPCRFLPLVGFVRWESAHRCASPPLAPPSTSRFGVHSRDPCGPLRRRGSHPRRTFRPRGFAPPRRLPPPERSRACCIPLPILGFAAFPTRPPRFRADRRLPRDGLRTPRRMFPSGSRTASPRPLPPCRSTASRPCSTFGSGTHAIGCPTTCALSFLGFVPPSRSFRTTAKLAAIVRECSAPSLSEDLAGEGEVANASNRAASPRSEDHERPIRSESLQGFASSRSRSSPSGVPGVCPEPKSRHHCR